jgi:hypothetical protein
MGGVKSVPQACAAFGRTDTAFKSKVKRAVKTLAKGRAIGQSGRAPTLSEWVTTQLLLWINSYYTTVFPKIFDIVDQVSIGRPLRILADIF